MKIIDSGIVRILMMLFCFLLVMGCDDFRKVPKNKMEEQKLIKELEAQAGFVLPENVELLKYLDDIARDGSKGYFSWGIFSPTAITTMPIRKEPYINAYLNHSLDTAEFVQNWVGQRKITQPQSVFSSRWEANGYEFRGVIVRTPKGDYMVVQRFRSRSESPNSQTIVVPSSPESQSSGNLGVAT